MKMKRVFEAKLDDQPVLNFQDKKPHSLLAAKQLAPEIVLKHFLGGEQL